MFVTCDRDNTDSRMISENNEETSIEITRVRQHTLFFNTAATNLFLSSDVSAHK